jgi:long-chain acyl-CoA synthetase
MFITQGLRRAASLAPNQAAWVYRGRTTTFGQLRERVPRAAGVIESLGLQRGDRLCSLALNSDRYFELLLGANWADRIGNHLNTRWSDAELVYAINDCGARLLAVDETFAPRAAGIKAQCPTLEHLLYVGEGDAPAGTLPYEALLERTAPVEERNTDPNATIIINYTGGTTGFSKGVMWSHVNMVVNVANILSSGLGVVGEASVMAVPGFHATGLGFLYTHLWAVNTAYLLPGFDLMAVLQLIRERRIGQIGLVPTMLQMVLDHPEAAGMDMSAIRHVGYGAAPISEALLKRAMQALPQAHFRQAYGLTECTTLAAVLPPEAHGPEAIARGMLRAAGRPVPFMELRIMDPEGRDVPAGERGEVAMRGLSVTKGYWNKPDLTAKALRDGWLYTGDAGYLDENGYLFLVDRVKDMIVSGGENVYSSEVEQAVASHPAVAGVAVIGRPDDKCGETVHAVVVLRPGASASEADIINHCRQFIGGYKLPRSVEFRDALPLTAAGKISKVTLREPYWAGHQRRI